ncbi:MAG: hypothetical protein H6514_09575 [Acidimicrobiaceae bacterium]|nr:hypothetical protein [Acidimicrobiaceae bacterium]
MGNAREFLDETFLVISGDVLTDIDLGKVPEFHREKGAVATITGSHPGRVEPARVRHRYHARDDGSIERLPEKPTGAGSSATINTVSMCSNLRSSDHILEGRQRRLRRGNPGAARGR